jgi:hypothetical protein
MVENAFKITRIWAPHYKGGLQITFLLFRRAVPHAQSQSVLAFVAIIPVGSFDACSAQHNYGLDLALHFFERVVVKRLVNRMRLTAALLTLSRARAFAPLAPRLYAGAISLAYRGVYQYM